MNNSENEVKNGFKGNSYFFNGKRISKKKYWNQKLKFAGENEISIPVSIRLKIENIEKIILLMEIWNVDTPGKLFEKLLRENFKFHNSNDKRVQILLDFYGCKSTVQLQNLLFEKVYSDISMELWKDKLNN